MVPVVGVDHAPTTSVAAMEAYTVAPPISAAVLIPPVREFGSASSPGPETLPSVSDHHVALTTVIANYCSFSTCIRTPIV